MNPSRIVIILLAGVAALVLAFLVHGMMGKKAPAVVAATPVAGPLMTRVLAAKVDLAVGDRLTPNNMAWQPWPVGTVNAAYVTDGSSAAAKPQGADGAVKQASTVVNDIANGGGPKLQALVGAIVREPIFAGEPITSKKIVRSGDTGYLAVRLPQGMRALSIPVTIDSSAGGFIEPGDRVDVMTAHADQSKGGGAGGMVAETVLSNVQVLAVDQRVDTPKNTTSMPAAATLTLEVPAGDVDALVRARTGGTLMMALRSYADIGGGPGAGAGVGGPAHSVRVFKGGAAVEVVAAR
jgi:pilus assembly protein CpaB